MLKKPQILNPYVFLLSVLVWTSFGSSQDMCNQLSSDACNCRQNRDCDFDVRSNLCHTRVKVCKRPPGSQCRRGGSHVYYSIVGLICFNNFDWNDCTIEKTVWAINLNGPKWTDINGIEFQAHYPPDENPDILIPAVTFSIGVPANDAALYTSFVWVADFDPHVCFSYKFSSAGDGEYEVSMKQSEFSHGRDDVNDKLFYRDSNAYLNGQILYYQFEPILYRPIPYGFDVNVNFKIFGGETMLQLEGQQAVAMSKGTNNLRFSVCTGNCSRSIGHNPHSHLASVSVVKLRK